MTRQWNKTTKKKLYLLVALGLALVLSSGTFAYTYVTSIGTIGVTPPTADIATCNATASQPDWGTVLVPAETTSTEILNPNAAGDETEIQSQIGAGSHWQLVDDWPTHDGDSTVVYTGNTGWEEDLYNLPSHSATSGNVTYVKVYIVCRSTAAPSQTNAYVHIKTGGVEHNGTEVTTGTSYSTFSYQWDDNPNTGDAWTWDEVDALQIGVALRQAGGGALTGCTQVYAEIGYGDIESFGEVPTGDLFTVIPNPGYVGDMEVGIHLTNTGSLIKAYQYLNMQVYMDGSVSSNQTPNYRLLTLQNGQTTLSLESLAGISGSFYQTSQADFESGNRTNLDTTTSPGDVILDAYGGNVTDNFTDQSKVASSANVTFSNNQVKLVAGGAYGTEILRPNAAGDDTNIDVQYPASGAHWDKVDEATADNYTTYVSTNSTSYQRDIYNIADHSTGSGVVDNVTAYFNFARTSAIGDVGIWQDTNNTHTIGALGTWTDVPFNSEVKTSGSFNHTSDTQTDLTADGWYLIMYEIRSTSTSNSRHSMASRVTLEGSVVEGGEGFGYARNDNNDEAYTAGACIVNASAGDTVVVQWRPYGVAATDVLSNSKTSLCIVRLPDSGDVAYLKYTDDSDTSAYSGTSWSNNVTWADEVYATDNTVVQKSLANDYTFTLKKVARYLVKYDVTFDNTASVRSQRISRALLAGSPLPQSHAYCYLRNSASTPGTLHALFIVDNTSPNQDLVIQIQRGNAEQDGSISRTVSSSSIEIMELPSGAEVITTYYNGAGEDITAGVVLDWADVEGTRDAGSFTIYDDETIEVEQDDDYLFMANGLIEDTVGSTATRFTFGADWYVDDSLQYIGGHGNYNRHDQSTSGSYNAGINAHSVLNDLNANQRVDMRTINEGDSGSPNYAQPSQCGFSALRIGSLPPNNAYARAAIKTGGSVFTGTEESSANATFITRSYTWTTNPSTNTTWTWSEIDGLQVGVELRSDNITDNSVCTQVYLEVGYTTYSSPGTLTSVNLLSGETVASIDTFNYDASAIPSGTNLQVQYSTDSTNWYNSLGVADGWDTMSQGTGNISLAPLGWSGSNFYYNMLFTTDGSDTPILDWIGVFFSTHYTSGNLTSSTYDTGDDQDWNWEFIYFTINEPTNTDLKFQIRSAATEGGLSSATWYGPTGTGDYYTTTITEINSVHDGDRWIQYRADFSSLGDATPTLSDIELSYTLASMTYTVEIIGGSYGLVSSNTSEWSPGWTITPEFYCEVTQR